MHFIKKYARVIAFDSLAVLCFIGVILFGWLPGPGGIPLFLAGLGFLAVNHDWAERLLEKVKIHGKSLKRIFFPKNRTVRLMYDVSSILLALASSYTLLTTESRLLQAASVSALVLSLFIFLVNRERLDKLSDIISIKHK